MFLTNGHRFAVLGVGLLGLVGCASSACDRQQPLERRAETTQIRQPVPLTLNNQKRTEAYRFVRAVIEGLAFANEAAKRRAASQPSGEESRQESEIALNVAKNIADTVEYMTADRIAVSRFKEAIGTLKPFSRSNNPAIFAAYREVTAAYQGLVDGCNGHLALQEKAMALYQSLQSLVDGGTDEVQVMSDLRRFGVEASNVRAQENESWRQLVLSQRSVLRVLHELDVKGGERESLKKNLTQWFPEAPQSRKAQDVPEMIADGMWKVLERGAIR